MTRISSVGIRFALLLLAGCSPPTAPPLRGASEPLVGEFDLRALLGSRAEILARIDRVQVIRLVGRGQEGFAAVPPQPLARSFEGQDVEASRDLTSEQVANLRHLLLDPASYVRGLSPGSLRHLAPDVLVLWASESVLVLRRSGAPAAIKLGAQNYGELALALSERGAAALDLALAEP